MTSAVNVEICQCLNSDRKDVNRHQRVEFWEVSSIDIRNLILKGPRHVNIDCRGSRGSPAAFLSELQGLHLLEGIDLDGRGIGWCPAPLLITAASTKKDDSWHGCMDARARKRGVGWWSHHMGPTRLLIKFSACLKMLKCNDQTVHVVLTFVWILEATPVAQSVPAVLLITGA